MIGIHLAQQKEFQRKGLNAQGGQIVVVVNSTLLPDAAKGTGAMFSAV
jgi:hypothetical protein